MASDHISKNNASMLCSILSTVSPVCGVICLNSGINVQDVGFWGVQLNPLALQLERCTNTHTHTHTHRTATPEAVTWFRYLLSPRKTCATSLLAPHASQLICNCTAHCPKND